MLYFTFELDDLPKAKQFLGNRTEPRKLMIQDNSSGGFTEFKVASFEWDETHPGRLVLGTKCHLPDELCRFPRWLRGWVRKAWCLRVQQPIVEWEVRLQDQEPNSVQQRLRKITDWLFARK